MTMLMVPTKKIDQQWMWPQGASISHEIEGESLHCHVNPIEDQERLNEKDHCHGRKRRDEARHNQPTRCADKIFGQFNGDIEDIGVIRHGKHCIVLRLKGCRNSTADHNF